MRDLSSEGLFIEPSGAVTLAGRRTLVRDGHVHAAESVVCVLTGSGFKDFERIVEMVEIPTEVISGRVPLGASLRLELPAYVKLAAGDLERVRRVGPARTPRALRRRHGQPAVERLRRDRARGRGGVTSETRPA